MNVLVLQPIRPSNPPMLRERADVLLERMCGSNPSMSFDICQDDAQLEIPPHPSLYMRHATVRNYMLDKYLRKEHTHVLWVDSDLVDYPADLPTLLLDAAQQCPKCKQHCALDITEMGDRVSSWMCEACGGVLPPTICAPMAVLDESPGRLSSLPGRERFYDIGGFIENGNRARAYPPWFQQTGDVIELDSVGCCYLAPAQLYHDGVRYRPPHTDYYVEHWSVMQEAKRRGYRICALTTVRCVHAWLPDYGLSAN